MSNGETVNAVREAVMQLERHFKNEIQHFERKYGFEIYSIQMTRQQRIGAVDELQSVDFWVRLNKD